MKKKNGVGIAAFILGIIGLLLSIVLIGIIPCIISLVLGFTALSHKGNKGSAICGISFSCVGILIFVLMLRTIFTPSDDVTNTCTATTNIVTGNEYIPPEPDDMTDNINVWATIFTPINDFRYYLDRENHTITLIGYDVGSDSNISKVLLSPVYTIDGEDYTLVSMGSDACFFGKTWIESVIIPEGVTYIEGSCFNSCGVTDVYLPSTLEEIPNDMLSYLGGNCKIYCNSKINLPSERDPNNYEIKASDVSTAEELGESAAGAINGFFKGLSEDIDNPPIVNIYFGGSDEQWRNLTNGQTSRAIQIDPTSKYDPYDLYDEGRQVGDKLSETFGNINW